MKLRTVASTTSLVLLISGAFLSGCASTPAPRCDTSHSVGSCAASVQLQGSRWVVCPVETANAAPVCMNTALNVRRAGQKQQVNVLLQPGHCQPLSTEITSAEPGACQAYALKSAETAVAKQ